MELKTKQTLAVVFSIAGAVGTLGMVFLARKAAMKEVEVRNGNIDIQSMKTVDKLKVIAPLYIPTMAAGVITIGSIIGSTVMSHKAQASLMSIAVLADQGWKKYKHQVKSTLGLDTHKDILKGIAKKESKDISMIKRDEKDTRELYYDEIVGYFQAKPDDVAFAYAEINEILNTDYRNQCYIYDFVTIGTFLKLANAELVDKNVSKNILNTWGWTMDYLTENYGWCWIHMNITHESSDDGVIPISVISWVEDPILIDIENVHGGQDRLSLKDIGVEVYDDILHKKHVPQEDLYEKKAETK